jgi:hypothetical protein
MCRDSEDLVIERAVAGLLKSAEPVTLESLRDAVGIKPREVELQAFEPDLSGYDFFCQEVSCG